MYYYCWCSWLLNLLNHYISNHFFSTRSLIFDFQLDRNNSETTLCQCISFSVWVNAQVGQSHHYHWLSWFKDEICFFFHVWFYLQTITYTKFRHLKKKTRIPKENWRFWLDFYEFYWMKQIQYWIYFSTKIVQILKTNFAKLSKCIIFSLTNRL